MARRHCLLLSALLLFALTFVYGSKLWAAQAQPLISRQLNGEDRALAAEVGFDEKALEIVKQATGSSFRKVELNFGNDDDDRLDFARLNTDHRPPLTADELQKFRAMGVKYPELKKCIDQWFASSKQIAPAISGMSCLSKEKQARYSEIEEKTRPFRPYLRQEADALKKQLNLRANLFISVPDGQHEKMTPDEIAQEMAKKFANVPLAEKYKPVYALKFSVPVDGVEPQAEPHIVSLTSSLWKFIELQHNDKTIERIQKQLKDYGYTIVLTAPIKTKDVFDNRERALAFAANMEKQPLEYVEISEMKALTLEMEIDPKSLENGSQYMFTPNQHFEKVGPNKWRFQEKPMYTVQTLLLQALLVKSPRGVTGGESDPNKFAFVRSAGTNGINYSIDTDMIVEKLEEWDKKYGVNVIEAKSDTLVVEFKTLPDDLSYLCTETWLFCPDLLDAHGDYLETAAAMRT